MNRILPTLTAAVCMLLAGCTGSRPDGWYLLTGPAAETPARKPITTVADFASLRLDSFPDAQGRPVYQIAGRLKENEYDTWGHATEQAAGKQIGFLYRGRIICSPRVNMRIDSGSFAISPLELSRDGRGMRMLYEQLVHQMYREASCPRTK